MFTKILIANRGEIACRIARTARAMGVMTVGVYSDADSDAAHVAACDEAIYIGPSPAKESYLNQERILEAAKRTAAQAIHPGYGFLSENAEFSQACAEAGIVFIGAPAESIRAMGSKAAAKSLMMDAGVPLVPGYHGQEQAADFLQAQAHAIGYPVIIKASAGGGGKGMRVVTQEGDFIKALESCKREAAASFGDDHVLIERYVSHPRHIEVQVFADRHGHCVYLFDRDCSVQRRHQKILEEAPAPMVSDQIRMAMGKAAVDAALAVHYEGAGTVEFIVESDASGQAQSFFFMEMNTRLQVEHPVTEMVTGEDLVQWQLRVAAGESLPKTQSELRVTGHAIEARIYAENPQNQFLPSTGTLHTLRLPRADGHAVRVDSGVRQMDTISTFYDPMIAKVITWGHDRTQARVRLMQALEQTHVVGVKTNVQFLLRLLACDAFVAPNLSTGLIDQNAQSLFALSAEVPMALFAVLAADQLYREQRWLESVAQEKGSAWQAHDSWTLAGHANRMLPFRVLADELHQVTLSFGPATIGVDQQADVPWKWQRCDSEYVVALNGHRIGASLYDGHNGHDHRLVFLGGELFECFYEDPLCVNQTSEPSAHALVAPMPGKVLSVLVKAGDVVQANAPLIIMEAMKMEMTIYSPRDGVVAAVHYGLGDQVAEGVELVTFEDVSA